NPSVAGKVADYQEIQTAAQVLGVELISVEVRTAEALEDAFRLIGRESPEALLVLPDALTFQSAAAIAALEARYHLPAMHEQREHAVLGGLMAYGYSLVGNNRRAADFVDRILKGARPADLPVEQPMTFEFVVNLRTAQALGITFPNEIMLQVTEVIE